MSVKAIGHVWDLELPANKRLVLLAYTDHADHEGGNIWPAVALIAWKTGYSERQVKRITKELVEEDKLLIPDGRGPHGVKRYKLDWNAGVKKEPYKGDILSYKEQSDNMSPKANGKRSDILTPKGDPTQESDILSTRGDILSKQSDIQMSPKPSLEPSLEPKDSTNVEPAFINAWLCALPAKPVESTNAYNNKNYRRIARGLHLEGFTPDDVTAFVTDQIGQEWRKNKYIKFSEVGEKLPAWVNCRKQPPPMASGSPVPAASNLTGEKPPDDGHEYTRDANGEWYRVVTVPPQFDMSRKKPAVGE